MDTEIIKITLAFLVLMNPFGALTLFMDYTKGYSTTNKRRMARLTSFTVFVTITFFTLAGELLLRALGISVGSFQIAGGILIFLIALNLLNGEGNPVKPDQENVDVELGQELHLGSSASAVVPLAIPMIVGPGGISTVVIYASQAHLWQEKTAIIISGLAIAIFCYLALMAAGRLSRLLGETGLSIMSRILGMLLAAVAIEIMVSGLRNMFPSLI